MEENEFAMRGDLGAAFEKLKPLLYAKDEVPEITINGERVERLWADRYRWKGFTGSFEQVAAKIRESNIKK